MDSITKQLIERIQLIRSLPLPHCLSSHFRSMYQAHNTIKSFPCSARTEGPRPPAYQIHLAVSNHGVLANELVAFHPWLTNLALEILAIAFTSA